MAHSNDSRHRPITDPEAQSADEAVASNDEPAPEPAAGGAVSAAGGGDGHTSLVEPPEQAVARLTSELAEAKDRYIRLAADFDNFRKRVQRERTETWARAQADVVANVLDALDDFGRVTGIDREQANVRDVLDGVELVERKLLHELESAGLVRVGAPGEPFDPNLHEAVGTLLAPSPDQEGTIAAVFQAGYQFGGAMLRPARVQVYVAPEG